MRSSGHACHFEPVYTSNMPKPRDPGEENIRALDDLKLAAADSPSPLREQQRPHPPTPQSGREEGMFPDMPAKRTYAPTPAPSRPIQPQQPGSMRRAVPEGAPEFQCISCGYGLFSHNAFRCSECGRQYDGGFLSAWFEGTEQARFNYLVWMVTAALVLKAWSFLAITLLAVTSSPLGNQATCFDVLVLLGGACCGIAACAWAGRDRMDTLTGYYAIAGMLAGGVMGVGALFGGLKDTSTFIRPAVLFASDALCGALFLLSLLQPVNGVEMWRAKSLRTFALPLAIGLPPAAMLLNAAERAIRESFAAAGGVPAAMQVVNSTSLMACVSFAIWIMARQWLVRFRKLVFVRPDQHENADVAE